MTGALEAAQALLSLWGRFTWGLITPSNLFPGLAFLGLTVAALGRRRIGTGLAWAGVLAMLSGLTPLANWALLPLEQRFPARAGDTRPVDGIIVLSGGIDLTTSRTRGRLELNDAGERITALIALAHRYPQARLVYTGGDPSPPGRRARAPEAVLAAAYLEGIGIAPARITVEARSRTTAENASEVRRLLEPHPGERWLLVTSAWHMPRAMGAFRRVGLELEPYPVDFRTAGPFATRFTFGHAADGLHLLDVAAKEWAGLVVYRLTGHSDALFPAPAADAPPSLQANRDHRPRLAPDHRCSTGL
ncbi:hypothetical protein MPPM_4169 [Methylorubrum populi]|uniref:DUF218 domain-containing protein n=1 Tax=Methylorubrum populi TaxID=223967 RepID=A0A160PIJ3_9HYPH|nr:YdcF family protein [Methylorubrum populi]BAU92774.1 hypothetical protein MPPM_4169 [Methylorubrum populi]